MNNTNEKQLITWIQTWYQQYCDGDWEHDEHFIIRNIDNPGWRITINLAGTHCEGETFNNIEKENTENEWFHCFLREGKFEGAGGPYNLIDILETFRDWAEGCQKRVSG